MELLDFLIWAQQQQPKPPQAPVWLAPLIFIVYVVFTVLAKLFSAGQTPPKNAKPGKQRPTLEEALTQAMGEANLGTSAETKPKREKNRKRSRQTEQGAESPDRKESTGRKALVRELAPQGEGARFDAKPGTLDPSLVVAPSIEPTVKPQLDSLTGIYEAAPGIENRETSSAFDLQKLLATPEGIRQAIIFGDILNRPEF